MPTMSEWNPKMPWGWLAEAVFTQYIPQVVSHFSSPLQECSKMPLKSLWGQLGDTSYSVLKVAWKRMGVAASYLTYF